MQMGLNIGKCGKTSEVFTANNIKAGQTAPTRCGRHSHSCDYKSRGSCNTASEFGSARRGRPTMWAAQFPLALLLRLDQLQMVDQKMR